ncbi:MAG: carbamate kinase [Chloroflexota bacterium]
MKDFAVIAFGGNAILPSGSQGTLEEQRENLKRMSEQLGRLVLDGHNVVVTHGNGPQVGEIMLKSDLARDVVSPLTLDVAGALSQGQIGYMLQQEIANFFRTAGANRTVCSIVTQVTVDANDPAFKQPTKPIGRFYSEQEASAIRTTKGWAMVEDAGRGYRRVVPSPIPLEIVEWPAIRFLVEARVLVIAAGGGGVPVVLQNGCMRGVEAVIDKDLAAARLASLVGARTLVLLTEVDNVAIDFGTPHQRALGEVSLQQMAAYHSEGQFPAGSMGPKVKAAIEFLQGGGVRAIITSTENLSAAVAGGNVGTQITCQTPTPGKDLPTLAGQTV